MKSGIYKITNTVNNKFYIGSSKDVQKRIKQHLSLLKAEKSHSKILQRAFNKYGESKFVFEILVYCPIEYLFKIEQWFVDTLKPNYNICVIDVSVPIGISHSPYKDKNKYSSIMIERHKKLKFGFEGKVLEKLDENRLVLKEYASLKEYATEHNCSIGNVGKALKKNNKCKGFYIRYKVD